MESLSTIMISHLYLVDTANRAFTHLSRLFTLFRVQITTDTADSDFLLMAGTKRGYLVDRQTNYAAQTTTGCGK